MKFAADCFFVSTRAARMRKNIVFSNLACVCDIMATKISGEYLETCGFSVHLLHKWPLKCSPLQVSLHGVHLKRLFLRLYDIMAINCSGEPQNTRFYLEVIRICKTIRIIKHFWHRGRFVLYC